MGLSEKKVSNWKRSKLMINETNWLEIKKTFWWMVFDKKRAQWKQLRFIVTVSTVLLLLLHLIEKLQYVCASLAMRYNFS